MKRIFFAALLMCFSGIMYGQVIFDLGLKAGVHTTNLDVDGSYDVSVFDQNYPLFINSESVTKMHWGAFGRVGLGRIYVQPEVYFSKKGGDLSGEVPGIEIGTGDNYGGSFDYGNVDVPILLGYKFIKGKVVNFRGMAGPVFSFITDADYPDYLNDILDDDFFEDQLIGVQYGLGIDVLFLTFDARVEHGKKFYDNPEDYNGKSTTFMFTLGFKIL